MGKVLCKFNSVNGQNTGAYVRTGPKSSYKSVGILTKKYAKNGFYIETNKGDSKTQYYQLLNPETYVDGNKKQILNVKKGDVVYIYVDNGHLTTPNVSTLKTTSGSSNTNNTSSGTVNNVTSTNSSAGLDAQIAAYLESVRITDLLTHNARVFGTPFQFTSVVDYRPDGYNLGRKYMENIICEAPVVYFTPGLPDYMPDADKKTKEKIDEYIKQKSSGTVSDEVLEKIFKVEARYYGFWSAYAEYIRYVNLLCRVSAIYLGIGDVKVPGTNTEYKKYNWGKWTNINYTDPEEDLGETDSAFNIKKVGDTISDIGKSVLDDVFGVHRFVKFYVDPSSSFSESANNSSNQSQIAGLFDSLESIVKEIGFFSNGGGIADTVVSNLQGAVGGIGNSAADVLDSSVGTGLSNIIGNASHVIQGSNIIFPELWTDSSYGKSYSFKLNLVSPYGDTESVYLNIIVPMMHILAFSMPRQTTANSFGSPFLIKVFSKGWFSCDLGMVDSVSIEKHDDSWNVNGLPTRVTINLSVKDLYTNLMISKSTKPSLFFVNQGLIEFLAVTCGVNITQANIGIKIDAILQTLLSTIRDIPSNVYTSAIEGIRNRIQWWFKL